MTPVETALLALLLFTAWTMLLVGAIGTIRASRILSGRTRTEEITSGVPHGSEPYWRLNRAHINAAENLPIFAAVVLVGVAAGVTDALFGTMALMIVAARLAQSTIHIASGSSRAVSVRFAFFLVQMIGYAVMGVIDLLALFR